MATIDQVTAGVDRDFAEAWGRRYLDAWNALDGETIASMCTEEVVWIDPAIPAPLHGREAVRELIEATGRAFPDLRIVETSPYYLLPGASRVLSPYRLTATMRGPMEAFAPTGRKLSVEGIDEWTFEGELLGRYCTYYDSIDAARQLGIMPVPGSRAEWLMARLQHLQARVQRRRAPAR